MPAPKFDPNNPASIWALMQPNQMPIGSGSVLRPDDFVAAPSGTQPPPARTRQAPAPITGSGESVKVTESFLSPEKEAELQALKGRLSQFQDDRFNTEQAGIDDYASGISDLENQKQNIDWRPLAGLVDQWAGSQVASPVAAALAPKSPAERKKELLALKQNLQAMKGNLSKSQYDVYKTQIDAIEGEKKTIAAERRADQRMNEFIERQKGTQGRFDNKQLNDLQKKFGKYDETDSAIQGVEELLGFNLADYDPATASVGGVKVNAPGVSVPILGRINEQSPEARRFNASVQALLNITLKERSGAAVTQQELKRLYGELRAGRGDLTTEQTFISTLKDFSKRLEANQRKVLGGVKGYIKDEFFENRERDKSYEREGGSGAGGGGADGGADLAAAAAAELARRKGNK